MKHFFEAWFLVWATMKARRWPLAYWGKLALILVGLSSMTRLLIDNASLIFSPLFRLTGDTPELLAIIPLSLLLVYILFRPR